MRRKHLLLSLLLLLVGAVSMKAQTDWWRTRATSFNAESYYLIFNANDGRYQYLYDNDGEFGSTHVKPSEFSVESLTSAYLFQLQVQDADASTYFVKAYNGKFVDFDGNTNLDNGFELTITPFLGGYGSGTDFYNALAEVDDAVVANANITAEEKLYRVQNGPTGWYWNADNGETFGTWSVAHPFAFYEVPQTVVEELLSSEHHDALVAAIAEYNAVFTTGSDAPGYFSATSVAAAQAAIATAQGVIDGNGSEADCEAALATLNAAINGISPNSVVPGIYKINLNNHTKPTGEYSVYDNGERLAWKALDEDDLTCYWYVEETTGGFTVQNAGYGTYMADCADWNAQFTLVDEPQIVEFVWLKAGQFNVVVDGGMLHAQSSGNESGNIVYWTTGADNASAWTLVSVAEIPESAKDAWEFKHVLKPALNETFSENINDWTTVLCAEDGLITDANQLSTNADQNKTGDADGGGLAALIDGQTGTYFHSSWQNDPTASGEAHRIDVKLTDAVGDFYFYFNMRRNGTDNSNRPSKITVSGKTESTDFTQIKVFDYDLTMTTSIPTSLWGIVEGGDYTTFRFEVNTTNTSSKYFSASEFQMYAVPASGAAKTIAENLNAYFSMTSLADANALADALVYTDEHVAELKAEVEVALAKNGVGYPKADDATRTELAEAAELDAAVVGNKVYVQTLEEALSAYKTSTNIQLPEDGKAYVISSVQPGATDFYFTINASNALELTETKPTSNEGFFICKKVGEKYAFVNANGGYLAFKGTGGTGWKETYAAGDHGCDFYVISANDLDHEKAFGTVAVVGQPNASQYTSFTVNSSKSFNQYSRAFDNLYIEIDGGWSTVQRIEEVATYPATTVNISAEISGVGNVATYSAKYPTVLPAGVTAYYATDNFAEGGVTTVEMTPLAGEAIPANTGVVLVSESAQEGVDMLPATTETIAAFEEGKETNYLDNSAGADKDLSAETGNVYILANSGDGVGFYALDATAGATIGMNKAYLVLPTAGAVKMKFGGNLTGIDAVENGELTTDDAPVYDLSGRKVANPAKGGVYIKNGKKYIVK